MGWFSEAEILKQAAAKGLEVEMHGGRVPYLGGGNPDVSKAAQTDATSPELFIPSCKHYGLPRPVPEYRFHPDRKWRFDYAWPKRKVALEIEGGVWTKGRHTRGKGFIKDIEKYNAATLAGWKILRCVPSDVKDESIFALLKRALTKGGHE
jgi:hypothetical protein